MKNLILLFLLSMGLAQAQAQSCPMSIIEPNGDGTVYGLILTNYAQCANYPNLSTVTINGSTYRVQDCVDDGTTGIVELNHLSGPLIILATSAPITFNGGGATGCKYNSAGNPIVLPIELMSFKGTPQYNANLLTWETVREVSSRGFEIQRLVGDNKWQIISFVKSKGAYGKYQFTDANPLATSYYRLRQLDNDGAETFSKIVTVANEKTNGRMSLRVYPNPVSNVLTIETDNVTDNFQVINVLGQTILSGKVETYGRMSQRLDVSALAQGTYILKIGTGQVKFVKQ